MSQLPSEQLVSLLANVGYIKLNKCADALQGTVWRAIQKHSNKNVVIKVADRNLHKLSLTIRDGQEIQVSENILKEKQILKTLCKDKKCTHSMIKYVSFFKSNLNYFLVMEDGGHNLFDFVVKVHKFITHGHLDISEWHRIVKIIFKQMIECIQYLHSKNICHFDVSLENWLINDIGIAFSVFDERKFVFSDDTKIQIKLIDFGLSELFEEKSDFSTSKFCGKEKYYSPEINIKKNMFNGKANDVWCLGICLYMMVIGGSPWNVACASDKDFMQTIKNDGDISDVLKRYNRMEYVDKDLIQLFQTFFKYEEERWHLAKISQNMKWLQP